MIMLVVIMFNTVNTQFYSETMVVLYLGISMSKYNKTYSFLEFCALCALNLQKFRYF